MDKKRDARAKLFFSLSQLLLFFAVLVVATVVVAPAPCYYYRQRVRQAKTRGWRGGIIQLISKRAILWGIKCNEIGHCRVPPGLRIKTKLSEHSAFDIEMIFHSHAIKTRFHKKIVK